MTDRSNTTAPNPGSDEALAAGCTCPVLDNARGKGYMCSGQFWISAGCPVHDALTNSRIGMELRNG